MPETPNTPPVRPEVQPYIDCFKEVGKPVTSLVDWGKPIGERRIDINRLRCLLLTEDRLDLNRRVMELPNYLDCRDEQAKGVRDEIIKTAIKAYGGTDPGFLDAILAEIDEATENGDTDAAGLSWLANLIAGVKNGWPRDPTARAALGDTVKFSVELVGAIAQIIARAVPGASGYINDTQTLIKLLVDMVFFLGDYVAEVEATQKEAAVRLLSYSDITTNQKPYGIGRVNTIRGAYAATNPGGASMRTVKAWCEAGIKKEKPYLAPDGTDGSYQAALALWQAQNEQAVIQTPKMVEAFRGSYERFIAANVIYAGIWNAYSFRDARFISEWIPNVVAGQGALLKYDSAMFQSLGYLRDLCGAPFDDFADADTLTLNDPNGIACKKNYYTPWWEESWAGIARWGYGINTDIRRDRALDYKRSILDAMNTRYFRVIAATGKLTGVWRVADFAFELNAVKKLWDDLMAAAYPEKGKTKRQREIKRLLAERWNVLAPLVRNGALMPRDPATAWAASINLVMTGSATGVPMPVASDPKYSTVKAPCPTGDTSCLPCAAIKGRRPLGAKVIQIPTLVEWSGNYGPLKSPEFAAWKKSLNENGYPDYYIDCLARDLTFKAKPGARLVPPLPGTPNVAPVPPNIDIKIPNTFKLSGVAGASGLTAHSIALLNGREYRR